MQDSQGGEMARPLRIEFCGALYHVASRGDRRELIFDEESDFMLFLDVLTEVVERFNWVCHAYCLMTNHYHLVIETPEANLAKGMRHLNGVFTPAPIVSTVVQDISFRVDIERSWWIARTICWNSPDT